MGLVGFMAVSVGYALWVEYHRANGRQTRPLGHYACLLEEEGEILLWGLEVVRYIDTEGKTRLAWSFDGEQISEADVLGSLQILSFDLHEKYTKDAD